MKKIKRIKCKDYKIYCCDNILALKKLKDNSVDSVVTDAPYGLGKEPEPYEMLKQWYKKDHYAHKSKSGFMGKKWDAFVPQPAFWKEVFRVLKPGGFVLSFFGTRTYDIGTLAMRLAGFRIVDQISWVYGTGFPKSVNVQKAVEKYTKTKTKEFEGFGSALKPSVEPIVLAQKPREGTIPENVLKYKTGGLNIDACRIDFCKNDDPRVAKNYKHRASSVFTPGTPKNNKGEVQSLHNKLGRFPANFIHDGSSEVEECFGSSSASRFFYCAKISKVDRNEGCENNHPTVKPTKLMEYLCKLVTPKNGTILDPFMGSGSTGKAAVINGFKFIGMEQDEENFDIAKRRIKHAVENI